MIQNEKKILVGFLILLLIDFEVFSENNGFSFVSRRGLLSCKKISLTMYNIIYTYIPFHAHRVLTKIDVRYEIAKKND